MKTQRINFYTKNAADKFLEQIKKSGRIKAYLQTLSSCRYQVRYWA